MPAKSVHQRRLFGFALAHKRGEAPDAPEEVKRLADSMTEQQLKDFAETPEKGLPETVEKKASEKAPPVTGPEAIEYALSKLDIGKMEAEQQEIIKARKVSKRPAAVKILNTIEGLKRNNLQPKDLMIHAVPVIPPAFRPFAVAGNTFVPGDANELYRDLIQLKDAHQEAHEMFGDAGTAESKLALYDSVKALTGYGEPVLPKTKQRGVSGFLKQITGKGSPKFGFTQRKLLSKPQDSVARGVITPDPDLGLDEIGVPKDMAWTMYAPYIQSRLVARLGMSPTDALEHVTTRSEYAENALRKEMEERPVIYSRAPSWHKFNVLAGRPHLIDGDSIQICNMISTGMGADYDGDQMNLHVPSHPDSVKEAYEKLMPSKMLFSIKDQDRIANPPKHEQILGAFAAQRRPAKQVHRFANQQQALEAIQQGKVSLSDEVEIA